MVYMRWDAEDGSRLPCVYEGCDKPILARGWCSAHYTRLWRHKDVNGSAVKLTCENPQCGRVMAKRKRICGKCNQARWRYGLSVEKFLEMNQPENRKCGNNACDTTERLYIDHDHACCGAGAFEKRTKVSCGKCVRGWLCQKCNTALGMVQDDIGKLKGLVAFLEDYAVSE